MEQNFYDICTEFFSKFKEVSAAALSDIKSGDINKYPALKDFYQNFIKSGARQYNKSR